MASLANGHNEHNAYWARECREQRLLASTDAKSLACDPLQQAGSQIMNSIPWWGECGPSQGHELGSKQGLARSPAVRARPLLTPTGRLRKSPQPQGRCTGSTVVRRGGCRAYPPTISAGSFERASKPPVVQAATLVVHGTPSMRRPRDSDANPRCVVCTMPCRSQRVRSVLRGRRSSHQRTEHRASPHPGCPARTHRAIAMRNTLIANNPAPMYPPHDQTRREEVMWVAPPRDLSHARPWTRSRSLLPKIGKLCMVSYLRGVQRRVGGDKSVARPRVQSTAPFLAS